MATLPPSPSSDNPPEPAVMIPHWLVLAPDVSSRAVRLYGILDAMSGGESVAWPSRRKLSDILQCSTDSVDRAIRELVAVCAITVERRVGPDGGMAANIYRLRGMDGR